MKQQKGTVNNIVGWLITALKEDFQVSSSQFNNCMESEYSSMENNDLEKMLGIR